MAQKLGKSKSESSAKQLNLTKQKLLSEKRVIIPGKQKQLNNMLLEAAQEGELKKTERLLNAGADINAKDNDGRTALMWTIYRSYDNHDSHIDICRLLIEKGADINAKSDYGVTALMKAAERGDKETCAFLIDKGAKTTVKDKGGWTVFTYAMEHDGVSRERELKKKGRMTEFLKFYLIMGKENYKSFMSDFKACLAA